MIGEPNQLCLWQNKKNKQIAQRNQGLGDFIQQL